MPYDNCINLCIDRVCKVLQKTVLKSTILCRKKGIPDVAPPKSQCDNISKQHSTFSCKNIARTRKFSSVLYFLLLRYSFLNINTENSNSYKRLYVAVYREFKLKFIL